MLTKLVIRNFKRFGDAAVELGNPVVFVGPNNSGKTTALQALALWDIGVRRWNEKRAGKGTPEKRPGVTINRRDLIAVPLPDANLLWRDLHVRQVGNSDGGRQTKNVRIDIVVEGVAQGTEWRCGLEFDYANEESFYCRPLRLSEDAQPHRMPIPPQASGLKIAFLPPMSGLAARETKLESGAINVALGEGRTADVLRNLCLQVLARSDGPKRWGELCDQIEALFGVRLGAPKYLAERGEITLDYRHGGAHLDISSSGRGLHQTLLLLAHLAVNPGAILLLDEPDAHLEILRQRQTYQLLTEAARKDDCQVIIASHSEVVLNEAADRDVVVAFLGAPHRIDDRGSQLLKALKDIGFDHYYQAEQTGFVLYLEGSTDLAILKAWADRFDHPAAKLLARPFVHYVENKPVRARDHFYGLREAKADLLGFALFDRLSVGAPPAEGPLIERQWRRREIENYLCDQDTLLAWARAQSEDRLEGPLFAKNAVDMMRDSIAEVSKAMETLGKGSPWSPDTKVTDDFLEPLFERFFKAIGVPNLMRKSDYHVLAYHVGTERIDPEVREVLDAIAQRAAGAKGAPEP